MKKAIIPFMILPFFLFGCGKDKNVYASSKNTIYEFTLNGDEATITGLNKNYKNQTDIIIPYSIDKHLVKRIESYSFEDVYRIKNVDMSKSKVEEIGDNAFKNCSNLVDIKYCTTIKSIGENAFEDCDKLVKMDLSLTSIDTVSTELFSKCDLLEKVTFPKTVKKIESKIFNGCQKITELDFSELEIEEIGDYAFYALDNLKDVTLSSTTKKIGNYAFADDKKIQFLDFKNTVIESIGDGAFSNCLLLANINVPTTLKTLGNKSFYYCHRLSKMDLSKTQVEVIPDSCFELCKYYTEDEKTKKKDAFKIYLPSTLTNISARAFYNSSIMSIVIPKSVTVIEDDALRLCKKLEEIRVDESNTNYIVHDEALYTIDKKRLIAYPVASSQDKIEISDKTTSINAYAFAGAVNLVEVDLTKATISEIEGYTFMDCTSLTTVKHYNNPELGIKKIGVKAFFGCKALVNFDGQHSITEIGESAFYDCTNLENLLLIESTNLTKIDAEAFYNCNKLKTITLPGSLEVVGRSAFFNCTDVESFSFGANKTAFLDLIDRCPDSCLDQYIGFIN